MDELEIGLERALRIIHPLTKSPGPGLINHHVPGVDSILLGDTPEGRWKIYQVHDGALADCWSSRRGRLFIHNHAFDQDTWVLRGFQHNYRFGEWLSRDDEVWTRLMPYQYQRSTEPGKGNFVACPPTVSLALDRVELVEEGCHSFMAAHVRHRVVVSRATTLLVRERPNPVTDVWLGVWARESWMELYEQDVRSGKLYQLMSSQEVQAVCRASLTE